MVGRSTINCPHFIRKIAAIYEASAGRDDRKARLNSDAQTAKRCGVAKSTVSTWRNGATDKNRPIGMLKEKHIQKLAEEFSILTDRRVQAEDAFRLWTVSSYEEFRRRLYAKGHQSLFSVLKDRPAIMEVVLFAQSPGLNMIAEALTPLAGELNAEIGDFFSLEVKAKKGTSLVVIATGPSGRFLLSPSDAHNGRVLTVPERVPRDAPWTFTAPGPHTIHIIELSASVPPVQRGRDDPIMLSEEQERALTEELLDPERSGPWRRGKVSIFVNGPLASVRQHKNGSPSV